VDPVWAVSTSSGDGAAHAARVALLEQVERRWESTQFLEKHRRESLMLRKRGFVGRRGKRIVGKAFPRNEIP
jgi:hypothetical protein